MTKQQNTIICDQSNLRKAIHLEADVDSGQAEAIKLPHRLAADIDFTAVDIETDRRANEASSEPVEPSKTQCRPWVYLSVVVLLLGAIELGTFILGVWYQRDWLAALWLIVTSVIFLLVVKMVIVEWIGVKQLKRQQAFQQQSMQMHNSPGLGQAHVFCREQLSLLSHAHIDTDSFNSNLKDHHNDAEIMSLFEQSIIAQIDTRVTSLISGHASACAAMIAVSPFALLDMLIVLWRNLVMIKQVSHLYGLNMGYWGRVKLIQKLFKLMLYAGAAEIISDVGTYAVGNTVTSKLSTSMAQGLGAGVLTARIGLKAMQECRPMPFLSSPKPGLNSITQEVLKTLKSKIVQ